MSFTELLLKPSQINKYTRIKIILKYIIITEIIIGGIILWLH